MIQGLLGGMGPFHLSQGKSKRSGKYHFHATVQGKDFIFDDCGII